MMNKSSKPAQLAGRIGNWIKESAAELGTEMQELLSEGKERRRLRSERREQSRSSRRNKNRMRRAIFGRTLLRMVIFSAVYWGLLLLISAVPALNSFAEDFLTMIFRMLPGSQYLSDVPSILIWGYLAVIILWPLISLYRVSGYFDGIYASVDSLLDRGSEPPVLPVQINDLDMKLRGVRLAIIQNEQLAHEAEQRKNDLVVYLAHDLKTPLSSVIGYLTLLEELPDLPVEQRARYTSITLDKAYRLEQLINEFFDITRFNLQSVELERNRIDLSVMLMQIADEFYPVLEEKKLTIRVHTPPRLGITGDADKLMRVMDNLLRNAVSYSYEGTEISLMARRLTSDSVEIICSNVGDEIPPQSLERLFEKFFRVDSARHSGSGGAGLGLAIARHIVELHGGQITATSSPEATRFRIVLPIKPLEQV